MAAALYPFHDRPHLARHLVHHSLTVPISATAGAAALLLSNSWPNHDFDTESRASKVRFEHET